MIEFRVEGVPLPQPRQRFHILRIPPLCPACRQGKAVIRAYGDTEVTRWKTQIAWEARIALRNRAGGAEMFTGPLLVVLQFVLARASQLNHFIKPI